MPISETAEGLALRLLASYPGVPASKMAVAALAESLDRIGLDIAERVVERARGEIIRVPSVAQLYEVAREIRTEIVEREHPALSPGEFVSEMPPEVRDKWHALQSKWVAEVARDHDAEDADWARTRARVRPRLRGVCSGAGKPAVKVDDKWVCPGCGEPIDEGCRPSNARENEVSA
jgi:hypothetical protein